MRTIETTRTEREVIEGNNGLSLYLKNLQVGRKSTPHSWLYENEQALTTLKRWLALLEKSNNSSPFGKEFTNFDLAQVKKFGPQGAVPPFNSKEVSEVLEPLFLPSEYDDPDALSDWYRLANLFGQTVFRSPRRGRRLSLKLVVDDARNRDTLNTNSGYPRFTRRNTVEAVERLDADAGRAFEYPAILLFRFYYGKLRPVWMYPMSMNLLEASFQQPIQKALSESPLEWVRQYLQPWAGYEFVKAMLTKQWSGQQVDGGDTTKMDAHMRPAQLSLVFEIVKWYFQEQEWDDLKRVMLQVCHIPMLISPERKIVGVHGLASGSNWTQLSETVLQLFMAWHAGVIGQGIGDDFYWLSDLSADQLVGYLKKFGLPANAEKQSVSNESLTFLQRMNHQSFFSRDDSRILGGYYPTVRALCSMLLPEKFHRPEDWNSDMFCTRNYTILENCVDDPCFDEFLRFVVQGHKDMIPFAKTNASELNRIQRRARRVPGLFPSYNQEKREKPLSEFTSIQLAKQL